MSDYSEILADLHLQRDRIDAAIAALENLQNSGCVKQNPKAKANGTGRGRQPDPDTEAKIVQLLKAGEKAPAIAEAADCSQSKVYAVKKKMGL